MLFEIHLINIAQRCEIDIGFHGANGFMYESAKDQTRWSNLSVKRWIGSIMKIGHYTTMKQKDFDMIHDSGVMTKGVSEMSADEINKLAGV